MEPELPKFNIMKMFLDPTLNKVNRINLYLSWFVIGILILIYYSIAPGSSYIQNMFSSDVMYLPAVFKDIFQDGYKFSDWNFNTAPYFFPDMVLFFILFAVAKSIPLALFLFAFCQFFLVLILIQRLVRMICPDCSHAIPAINNLLFTLFILATIIPRSISSFSYYLLTPGYHTGSFINTLLVLLISITYLNKKQNIYLYFT